MTEQANIDPARLRRRARRMKRVNVLMRRVLGLPFKTPLSSRLMLLFVTGRKTGRAYRQPVSFVRDGGTLLTPGGGKWKLNLREGEPIRIRLAGRDVLARPQFVRDPGEIDRLLRYMMSRNRRLASFVPFIDRHGKINPRQREQAVRHGF